MCMFNRCWGVILYVFIRLVVGMRLFFRTQKSKAQDNKKDDCRRRFHTAREHPARTGSDVESRPGCEVIQQDTA